jgi:hypothetical protein
MYNNKLLRFNPYYKYNTTQMEDLVNKHDNIKNKKYKEKYVSF